MKIAIIYRRASTNQKVQTNSLDNQARRLYEFAEVNGYKVVEDIAEYQSASKKVDRPGFNKALNFISQNEEAVLITHDLTRLSRDIGSWDLIAPILPRIRFANRGDAPLTELEASLLLVIAANESRILSERTAEGIKRAKERKLDNGEEWKWGTGRDPVEARAAYTGKTSDWRASIRNVCSVLEAKGMKTYKAKTEWLNANGFRSQRGNAISIPTLRNALTA